jgi:transcription elongation factor
MKISEQTAFKTDLKTLVMIVAGIAIAGQVEKLTERVDDMMHNKVMISSIAKDLDKVLNDVEKLKDSVRSNIGKLNGDH